MWCGLESQMLCYWLYLFLTFNFETIIDSVVVAKIVERSSVSFSFFPWFHLTQL